MAAAEALLEGCGRRRERRQQAQRRRRPAFFLSDFAVLAITGWLISVAEAEERAAIAARPRQQAPDLQSGFLLAQAQRTATGVQWPAGRG